MPSRPENPEIAVVGAGVIGLSSALRLLQAGRNVVIYAREESPRTTSDVAAAFWLPYKVAADARVRAWALRTRDTYRAMKRQNIPGVSFVPLTTLADRESDLAAYDEWSADRSLLSSGELPAGVRAGRRFSTALIDTPRYMPWLRAEVARQGARVVVREIKRLDELTALHSIVINCTGVGAKDVAPDPAVFPIQGQVVRVRRPVSCESGIFFHERGETSTYIVIRQDDCILGGTAVKDAWETAPDPAVAAAILARCVTLLPELAGAEVLGHRVGLRPGREPLRLEREPSSSANVIIHNYGHGGSGFTLAWACADEVVRLVE